MSNILRKLSMLCGEYNISDVFQWRILIFPCVLTVMPSEFSINSHISLPPVTLLPWQDRLVPHPDSWLDWSLTIIHHHMTALEIHIFQQIIGMSTSKFHLIQQRFHRTNKISDAKIKQENLMSCSCGKWHQPQEHNIRLLQCHTSCDFISQVQLSTEASHLNYPTSFEITTQNIDAA